MQTAADTRTILILLIITLLIALLARRLQLPYTLVLVLTGLTLGILRILPGIRLDPDIVLFIFLPALLFEGAWSMDPRRLRADWFPIFLLAVPGLLISLGIVGAFAHWGAGLNWPLALLLGAIVSPTDPVAILSLFRQLQITPRLRSLIEGESLFNDGVGAVAFVVILMLVPASDIALPAVSTMFLRSLWELFGGPLLGITIGYLVSQGLRVVDDYLIEMTVTVGVAFGSYLLATALQTSGLLAVVCAGLTLASVGRSIAFSEQTQAAVDMIWQFIGYVANSLLFLILGIQIGAAQFIAVLPAIIWVVIGVVLGRAVMLFVCIPIVNMAVQHFGTASRQQSVAPRGNHLSLSSMFPPPRRSIPRIWRPILLLAGLRGALSLVLVLSLAPNFPARTLLTDIVYGVVLFTLVGQGVALRAILPHMRSRLQGADKLPQPPPLS